MEINISLLKKICETPGTSGFENRIRALIKKEVEPLVDECRIDTMGNLIAIKKAKKANSKKLMLAAHMDEIGFITNYIDKDGFIRFNTIGGFDPKTLTAQRVIVHGKKDLIGIMGCKPIHMMSAEETKKLPEIKDYFIDLGMSKEEVEKYVSIGDPITRERNLIELGDCISSKSMDNRISVFILIETLRLLKEVPYDLYAVFTVQEEVGIRGAHLATHEINPEFGIAIDVTIAYDTPGAQEQEKIIKLGQGVAIKIMDKCTICDYRMISYLKSIAKNNNIPYQLDVRNVGGTDAEALQLMGKSGAITGAISIPTRYIHQVVETIHKSDLSNTIALTKQAIENIANYSWEHI
jgi:putative aminopeptidase FrvX